MELIQSVDVGVWNFFQDWRRPGLIGIGYLGSLPALLIVFVGVVLYYQLRRRVRVAVFLLAVFGGAFALALLTQALVARDRPDGSPGSYPSEETFLATATFLALGLTAGDQLPGRRRLLLAGAGGLVLLIGLGQMFIGRCYPTDVIGGWLGGGAWVLFCRWVDELWSVQTDSAESFPAIPHDLPSTNIRADRN